MTFDPSQRQRANGLGAGSSVDILTWVLQPTWHELMEYLEQHADALLDPGVEIELRALDQRTDVPAITHVRVPAVLDLLETVRDEGFGAGRAQLFDNLTRYEDSSDATVRLDAKGTMLVILLWEGHDWWEYLQQYVDDVLSLDEPSAPIERAISLLRSRFSDAKNDNVAQGTVELGLGTLYLNRRAGNRVDNVAISLNHFLKARRMLPPPQAAEASLWIGQAYARLIEQNPRPALEAARQHLLTAQEAQEHLSSRRRYTLHVALAYVLSELAARTALPVERRQLVREQLAALDQAQAFAHDDVVGRAGLAIDRARAQLQLREFESVDDGAVLESLRSAIERLDELDDAQGDVYERGRARIRLGTYLLSVLEAERGSHRLDVNPTSEAETLDEVVRVTREALSLFEGLRLIAESGESLTLLGRALLRQQRWEEAERLYQGIVDTETGAARAASLPIAREVGATILAAAATNAAYCRCRLGRPELDAVHCAEQGVAQTAIEQVTLNALVQSSGDDPGVKTALRELADLELEAKQPADAHDRRRDGVLAELIADARRDLGGNLKLTDANRSHATVDEVVRAALNVHDAIVHVIATEVGTAVVVVTKQGCELRSSTSFSPLTTTDLTAPLGGYAIFLAAAGDPTLGMTLEARRGVLRESLNGLSGCADTIDEALMRHGVAVGASIGVAGAYGLASLPLGAVPLADGQMLDERYQVTPVPSWYLVHRLGRSGVSHSSGPKHVNSLAVTAATDDLPFAALEGKLVTPRMRPVTWINGAKATRAKVLADLRQTSGVAYFACHAAYDAQAPWASRIYLTTGSLAAADVAALNLDDCELVVLSACESAVTDIRRAPFEYVGLRTAFMIAGANEVLGTLWRVPDASTAVLMSRVMTRRGKGGKPLVGHLTEAQQWLRSADTATLQHWVDEQLGDYPLWRFKDRDIRSALKRLRAQFRRYGGHERPYEHPYYWAGFTSWQVSIPATR